MLKLHHEKNMTFPHERLMDNGPQGVDHRMAIGPSAPDTGVGAGAADVKTQIETWSCVVWEVGRSRIRLPCSWSLMQSNMGKEAIFCKEKLTNF